MNTYTCYIIVCLVATILAVVTIILNYSAAVAIPLAIGFSIIMALIVRYKTAECREMGMDTTLRLRKKKNSRI